MNPLKVEMTLLLAVATGNTEDTKEARRATEGLAPARAQSCWLAVTRGWQAEPGRPT